MIFRFFIFMCLFLGLSASSSAQDPFALLFGDDVIDAGQDDKSSADNITLLRFTIRNYLIDESWSAFETQSGLCLLVKSVTEALEFPITYTKTGFDGWVLDKDQTVSVTYSDDPNFTKTDLGWCAPAETLETLFPVKINYSTSTLTLQIDPTITLPMDARLERLAARQMLGLEAKMTTPDYKMVENDYRWMSLPIIDVNLDMRAGQGQQAQAGATVDMAADLMKMSARLNMAIRHNKALESLRVTLFRESEQGDQLGPLKARRFALGDVSTFAQPLLSKAISGRGAVISNRPLFLPDQFDQTTLRGALPAGWDAELYEGDILLDFVTEADNRGDYVFENVALRPGYNRLTVKLFGLHGQEETRTLSQFVGSELCPSKKLQYALGFIDPKQALFDDLISEKRTEADLFPDTAPYGFISLTYGLSTKYALRFDVRAGAEDTLGTFSLIGSQLGGYGVLRIASGGYDRPAIEAQFQRRLFDHSSFSIRASDYGGLITDISGRGPNPLTQEIDLRVDTHMKIGRWTLPMQNSSAWSRRADGHRYFSFNNRLSGRAFGTRWSNSMNYFSGSGESGRLQGELLASRRMGGGRVRASLNYAYNDGLTLEAMTAAYQRKFNRDGYIQTNLNYNMRERLGTFDAALSHNFKAITLSLKSGVDTKGGWNMGLGLSLALFHDPHTNQIALARPGLSRTGVIAPRIFDDVNENGRFDSGDQAVSGAQFITDNSLRSETGNEDGIVLLADLPTAKVIASELKLSSISDPFLYPHEIGRNMTLRPGQVLAYDVPLLATGEAEGSLFFQKEKIKTPIAGVVIEAINADEKIVATTVSEYDGYFYFTQLPAMPITLRVSPNAMQDVDGTHTPVNIQLSREDPTASGLKLVIMGAKSL